MIENDEIIDKAFKSRLIHKLGFEGCPDYDMSLFGDDFGESWSNFRDNLQNDFTDANVLHYLKSHLDCLASDDRTTVFYYSNLRY